MATTISFGIQKGGVGKSTSAGVTSYLLAKKGYKVLAVDLDSQGNLTQFLSGVEDPCDDFFERTVLDAMLEEDATTYVAKLNNGINLLPSNDFTAPMPRLLVQRFGEKAPLALHNCLNPIRENYDFIILDLPPALSDQTLNGLATSDYSVVMFESGKFCYNAIGRFLELIAEVKKRFNPTLEIGGILRTLTDARRSDSKAFVELIEEDYPELCFETVILRRAAVGRLPITGFENNSELKQALVQYELFLKELLRRVEDGKLQKSN